jgi:hypothetical protein
MVATFSNGLETPTDRMRAALGDRDTTNPLRQDEEYEANLALAGDELLATAVMAEGLAAEFAQRVDAYSESGGISVRWSERVKTWLALAAAIRAGLAAAVDTSSLATVSAVAVRANGGWTSEYVRGCSPWGGRPWFTE